MTEQQQQQQQQQKQQTENCCTTIDDNDDGSSNREKKDNIKEEKEEGNSNPNNTKHHQSINPFLYLATETLIPSHSASNNSNDDDDVDIDIDTKKKKQHKKKKHWLQYETTSLIPLSPHRQGSAEDVSLPYSMELWRKAKILNRDRSVLACAFAHLIAMKTLVESKSSSTNEDDHDESGGDGDDKGFDFILEDNVRVFTGEWNNSCECANRIWDVIEASNNAPSTSHMKYFGWLGSLPMGI